MNSTVIGYIPLFLMDVHQYPPTESHTMRKWYITEAQKAFDKAPEPEFCLWGKYPQNEEVYPIIGIKDAKKVYEHILAYSENKPQEWFDVIIKLQQDKYYIVILPKFEKAIERYKLINLHFNEAFVPDGKVMYLCKPLIFRSMNRGVLDKITIPDKIDLGFLDSEHIKTIQNNLNDVPEPFMIKSFKVNPDGTNIDKFLLENEKLMEKV